jgi:glycosyltransferase involved in cell wall biosynthesis
MFASVSTTYNTPMNLIPSTKLQGLILTKNEEPNLFRVLEKLKWIEKVLLLDSFSTDRTLEIAMEFPNVTVVQRTFDTFAAQCNYGLSLIDSQWVLSLDADYVLTEGFIAETKSFVSKDSPETAYFTKFEFLVFGRQLISNNTTPRAVLFRSGAGVYFDDGHAHRLKIAGPTGVYQSPILHDDRKSFSRWLSNQDSYSVRECTKLTESVQKQLSMSAKVRKNKIIAPFLVFFHCLIVKRLIFSGWAGWHYTLQRTMVEMILAIRLIERENLSDES